MGATTSSPADIHQFQQIVEKLKQADFKDYDEIITAAGNIRTLNCISNAEFQQYYLKEPNNIIMLIIRCIDVLYGEKKLRSFLGALLLLSKVLPVIAVSYNDITDLNWFFEGEQSVFERLMVGIKSTIFALGITSSTTAEDPNAWLWEKQDFDFENARYDIMAILNFAISYEYFFEEYPEVQKRMKQACLLEAEFAKHFVTAILGAITNNFHRFIPLVINYFNWALHNDDNVIAALKESNAGEVLSKLAYSSIDNLNTIVNIAPNIDPIELDIQMCILQLLLSDSKIESDSRKLLLSALRLLQLSNDKGVISTTHRITLTLLLLVTSNKKCQEALLQPLEEKLGVKRLLHTESISIALIESVSEIILHPKGKELRTLGLGIIHNIAPGIIANNQIPPNIFVTLLQAFGIREYSEAHFKAVTTIITRYLTSGSDQEKEIKNKLMEDNILKIYDLFDDNCKKIYDEAKSVTQLTEDYPMVITDPSPHFRSINIYLKQLYIFRNKASLLSLRKNAGYVEKPKYNRTQTNEATETNEQQNNEEDESEHNIKIPSDADEKSDEEEKPKQEEEKPKQEEKVEEKPKEEEKAEEEKPNVEEEKPKEEEEKAENEEPKDEE